MDMIESKRLLLRHWKPSDLKVFREMNQSRQVMQYFPSTLDNQQSDLLADRIQRHLVDNNWGLWALELKETGRFIGFTGLQTVSKQMPFYPATEIGWRLDSEYWRKGYASEAATRVIKYARETLQLQELVSFTATSNSPSIGVMKKIGMRDSKENFMHPKLPDNHPLKEHVLFRLTLL